MKYELPQLYYSFNGLEPYLDAQTVETHYTKHHQKYLDNMNNLLIKYPQKKYKSIEDLLKNINRLDIPETDKTLLKNNAGGYVNHNIYWENMGPEKEIDQALVAEITEKYGTLEKFRINFTEKAMAMFGSGWTWLVRNSENKLELYNLPNQDSPYVQEHTPIIALDIWEHAYYLKYKNNRADYVENWWKILKII